MLWRYILGIPVWSHTPDRKRRRGDDILIFPQPAEELPTWAVRQVNGFRAGCGRRCDGSFKFQERAAGGDVIRTD